MPEQLRLGLAGCGAIARQVHLPLLHLRHDVRLVAIADSNADALAGVARWSRDASHYRNVEEMVSNAGLDAVIVALPPALHASAARTVFDAGLHLYLEKPMAPTLEDGLAITRAWQRSGRVGVIGFNCRANPLYVRLRELIRAGRAGAVVYFQTFLASAARTHPAWKVRRESGGGALLDLGVHHIDLIRFLTGREITGVRASVLSRASDQDTALVELQLDGGIAGHAFFSLAAAEGDHVEIHGDAARLAVDRYTSVDVRVTDNPGRGFGAAGRLLRRAGSLRYLGRALQARRSPLREPGYAVLLDRFIRAAHAGVLPDNVPHIADGFAATAAVVAAEASLVTGQMEAPAVLDGAPESLMAATS